jgi:hypothetical protein
MRTAHANSDRIIEQTGSISFDTAVDWATGVRASDCQGGHDRLPRVPPRNRALAMVNDLLISGCGAAREVCRGTRGECFSERLGSQGRGCVLRDGRVVLYQAHKEIMHLPPVELLVRLWGVRARGVLSVCVPLARAPGRVRPLPGVLVVKMVADPRDLLHSPQKTSAAVSLERLCACGRPRGQSRPRANPVWGTGRGGDDRVRKPYSPQPAGQSSSQSHI